MRTVALFADFLMPTDVNLGGSPAACALFLLAALSTKVSG